MLLTCIDGLILRISTTNKRLIESIYPLVVDRVGFAWSKICIMQCIT